jgi:mRNA-degrading endonuclease RelE of RelBE toxin-antitoxin system
VWRIREGDIRVVYRLDFEARLITVLFAGPRGQAYRD